MRARFVTGHAAAHPVARALAKRKVHDMLLSAKLQVYLFEDGTDVSQFMSAVLQNVAVVGMAAERQWREDMPRDILGDMRVLRGGMSAIEQTLHRWDSTQAVAIEQCLIRVERLNGLLKAEHVYEAYLDLLRLEAKYATPTPA